MPQATNRTPEERLAEIQKRLKRASGGLSREMDFLWAIRELTELSSDLWQEVKALKEKRYGSAPKRR